MVEAYANRVVVDLVAPHLEVVRDRDFETRWARMENVIQNTDVLGSLDPQSAVLRAVRDVPFHHAVGGKGREYPVLQVVDRLVFFDTEVVHVTQVNAVAGKALNGEALDPESVDNGIGGIRLDQDAVFLSRARQEHDLLGPSFLADHLQRLVHPYPVETSVRLRVGTGHHQDLVSGRGRVYRRLDRVSGVDLDRARHSCRRRTHDK